MENYGKYVYGRKNTGYESNGCEPQNYQNKLKYFIFFNRPHYIFSFNFSAILARFEIAVSTNVVHKLPVYFTFISMLFNGSQFFLTAANINSYQMNFV